MLAKLTKQTNSQITSTSVLYTKCNVENAKAGTVITNEWLIACVATAGSLYTPVTAQIVAPAALHND